jgi:hypothetical protein
MGGEMTHTNTSKHTPAPSDAALQASFQPNTTATSHSDLIRLQLPLKQM